MHTHITRQIPTIRQLNELGDRLACALWNGPCPLETLEFVTLEEVFLVAIESDDPLSPEAALTVVTSRLASAVTNGDYASSTVTKAIALQARLAKYLGRSRRIANIADVTQRDVNSWINVRSMSDRQEPSARTKDNRRWAADMFFRELRSLGLYDGDPLLDVRIDRGERNTARALTTSEIHRCRFYSARNRQDTRGPTAWALAESGASTSELANIVVPDIDINQRRVWLWGSRLQPRWGALSDWALPHLRRRIELMHDNTIPLIYQGNGTPESRQASAVDAIHEILGRAELRTDATVKPSSVRAWLAHSIYIETSNIFVVAHRLGLRQLDNARELLSLSMLEPDTAPAHRWGDA